MSRQHVTVEAVIMNQTFMLTCDPDEQEALKAAVKLVNAEMEGIRDSGMVKAKERIAVLAALNLAHSLGRARQATEAAQVEAARLRLHADTESARQTRQAQESKMGEIVKKLDVALQASGFTPVK